MARTGRPKVFGDTTQISVRLDNDLLARLDRIANHLEIGRADAVRSMLEYVIDAVETGHAEMTTYINP